MEMPFKVLLAILLFLILLAIILFFIFYVKSGGESLLGGVLEWIKQITGFG